MAAPFYPKNYVSYLSIWLLACGFPLLISAQNQAQVQCLPAGGLFTNPLEVVLSSTTPNAALYYTLDGTEPDANAFLFNQPIAIDTNTVLRFRAFAPGVEPSPVITHSYFIGLQTTFPVVSLVFPPAAFFDSLSGIYTHYTNGQDAVSNLEFFEKEVDTAVLNQLVAVEIQGTSSVVQPQKSLEIKAKKSLGWPEMHYPVFPDLPYDNYKRFVLRNGGQDWCVLQFRDELATSLVGDLSDLHGILTPPQLFLQAWRPAIVYLNGQYWGIHNIRERMTQFYVRQHLGWADEEYDLIENFSDAAVGDSLAWFAFAEFLQQHDFSDDAQFELLKQQIDYQNFLDYCVYNVYLENEDWPGNNVRRFRHRSPDGRWEWLTYDLDFTFGLYQSGGTWNTGAASPNALGRLLDSTSIIWPNPDWATLPFRRCWQNASFRRDFANRLADMLNTNLLPQRIGQRLNQFRALYEPEIAAHYQRWWGAYIPEIWLDNIAKTRSFTEQRPGFVRQEIISALPDSSALVVLNMDAYPRQGGSVQLNTVHLDSTSFPWSGVYFQNLAIPVKAVAAPGHHFLGWSDQNLGSTDSINLILNSAQQLTAIFEADHGVDTTTTSGTLEITLLPNPAAGTILFSNSYLANSPFQVQVVDALGRVLLEKNYPAQAGGVLPLQVGNLTNGIYFLHVRSQASARSGTKGFSKM